MGFTGRGVATMDILVSADNVTYTSVVGGSTFLAIASGLPGEAAQTISLSGAYNIQFVQFALQTAHSGEANEYVGLSEVRFDGVAVPEPSSIVVLGVSGVLALVRRRRGG